MAIFRFSKDVPVSARWIGMYDVVIHSETTDPETGDVIIEADAKANVGWCGEIYNCTFINGASSISVSSGCGVDGYDCQWNMK